MLAALFGFAQYVFSVLGASIFAGIMKVLSSHIIPGLIEHGTVFLRYLARSLGVESNSYAF